MEILNIFSKKKKDEELNKEKIKVEVDWREKNSLVASELIRLGMDVEFKQLLVGDYIVRGCVIERKTINDLKSSIIDKRIFTQLQDMKQFEKSIVMVEGNTEMLYSGRMHENALRGFLLSVALDYNVPVIYTLNEKDTARYIYTLSKKEKGKISIRASKTFLSEKEQMQFILEGFPHVGPAKAKKLIEKFGSLKNIINANEVELNEVLGKRAWDFFRIINYKYLNNL